MYDTSVRHTNGPANDGGPVPGGVVVDGLGKRFGDLWALRGLDLVVAPGTVLGLLGHNGAGKTTALRILTTLTSPTEGRALVAGFDVSQHPREVQRRIGVAAQENTVDGLLSARLNLELIGRLHHLPKAAARRRAGELLERLDLAGDADRLVKTFSGGMRRRLDLAASLISQPEVLFLDEPTTGLDPRSRGELWQLLRDLVRDGTTLILTTQYLEEADRLADDIVVLHHGATVAHGTPAELKTRIGDDRIDVKLAAPSELVPAAAALNCYASNDPSFDQDLVIVTVPVVAGTRLVDVVRTLDDAGVDAIDVNRRQATLDDVFLTLTASDPEEAA
jgi:ABC-2 type transport system ATP-binding protein